MDNWKEWVTDQEVADEPEDEGWNVVSKPKAKPKPAPSGTSYDLRRHMPPHAGLAARKHWPGRNLRFRPSRACSACPHAHVRTHTRARARTHRHTPARALMLSRTLTRSTAAVLFTMLCVAACRTALQNALRCINR
jgi:hypothetical protein